MIDRHEQREKAAAEARERAEAEEKTHVKNLIESESGKWLFGRLLKEFEKQLRRRSTGHNSEDCYQRGMQDCAGEYRDLIVKHFGHAGIDKILKGKS